MKRIWQALAGVGILVVALVIAAVVFLSTIDPNDYRGVLSGPIKQATGRDLTLTGVRELKIGFPVAITVDGAQLSNASWGSRPEMVTMERIEAELAVLPLILGELEINRIVVRGVDLLLETDTKERGNWVLAPVEEPKAPGGTMAIPFVRELALRDVTVSYRDGITGRSLRTDLASLELSAENRNSPISLNLEAKINQAPVALKGTIGALRGLFYGSQPFPVALEAQALGATFAAKGVIEHPLEATGLDLLVSLTGEGLAEEAARAGLVLPELPAFSVTGRLTDPEGRYNLEDLKADLGKTSVTGQAKFSLDGKRPKIEAALGAQVLDLSDLDLAVPDDAAIGRSETADRGKRLIPDLAMPIEMLGALDAKLSLKVDRLALIPGLTAEQATLRAELDQGALDLKSDMGRLAQGRLSGRLKADQTGAVSAHLEARSLVLSELLKAFGDIDVIEDAPFDADLNLLGKGADLRALVAGTDGEVKVVIGEGRVQGRLLDLAGTDVLSQLLGAIDPGTKEKRSTQLQCGVIRATVKSGTATFDKGIGIETDKIDILGAGTIDLKTEAVDLGIRTEAREGLGISVAGQASKLIRIKGTLAEPSVGADALGAAETAARVGGAVMTGGLSLLGEFAFGKLMGRVAPCKLALGDTTGEALVPDKEEKSGAGGVLEGIGQGLKSLFGD